MPSYDAKPNRFIPFISCRKVDVLQFRSVFCILRPKDFPF